MDFDTSIFSERFYKLRENAKMSQFDFAKFLGIPTGSVGDYENGKKMPNSKALYKIAKKCNVSTDYLLGLSSIETPNTNTRAICEATGLSEKSVNVLQWYICPANKEAFDDYLSTINFFIESQYKSTVDDFRVDALQFDLFPEADEDIFYDLNLVDLFSSYLYGEYKKSTKTAQITDSDIFDGGTILFDFYKIKHSDLIGRFLLDKINDSLKVAQVEIIKRQKGGEDNG